MQQDQLRKLLQQYAVGICAHQEQEFLEGMMLGKFISGDWYWGSQKKMPLMRTSIKNGIDRRIHRRETIRGRYLNIAASAFSTIRVSWFTMHESVVKPKVVAGKADRVPSLAAGLELLNDFDKFVNIKFKRNRKEVVIE